mgnify:CR=1 FL=1
MVEAESLILSRTKSLIEPQKQTAMEAYYRKKIEEMEFKLVEKQNNLRRLEAQRNEMNAKVKDLKEELHKLLDRLVGVLGRLLRGLQQKLEPVKLLVLSNSY